MTMGNEIPLAKALVTNTFNRIQKLRNIESSTKIDEAYHKCQSILLEESTLFIDALREDFERRKEEAGING